MKNDDGGDLDLTVKTELLAPQGLSEGVPQGRIQVLHRCPLIYFPNTPLR